MKHKTIIPYDPKLKDLAKQLRENSALSEVLLWNYLKGKQILGYDFDWQKPIDNYIVAFFCYDSLGRKTQMVDPDMGQWFYSYDGVGHLILQTDAKGITTKINYDPLNRKFYIDYPNDNDVVFMYDVDTKGTLSMVYSGAGTASYQSVIYMYDQQLRKTVEGRTIDGNTWETRWAYDSMDRVTSMTYPDVQTAIFN